MRRSVVCLFLIALATAAEKRIKLSDMPAAARKTAEEQSKGAEVLGYTREVEKGKTYFEVETRANGKTRDVLIDEAGTMVEVEQQVDLASIPVAAKAALEKMGKVGKVESVTKGSTVTYEATVQHGLKKSEVKVSADGQRL